jgi:uncharacterized protein VirK/YbjX
MEIATREDVIACYRHILGREPEDEETLSRLIGWDFWELVKRFAHSDEHKANISPLSSYSILKFNLPNYLSAQMSSETRLSSVIYNYSTLRERFAPECLMHLMQRGLPLIDGLEKCPRLTVEASVFSGPTPEGEISLIASLEGRRVAVLSFTIVEGPEFHLNVPSAFLISRVQGYRGVGADVNAITSALDVAPPLILMAALTGVAKALNVHSILGVAAHNHPDFKPDEAERMERAYDSLFISLHGQPHPGGYFHMDLRGTERSRENASGPHRARSRRRRSVRQSISFQVEARCRGYLREAAVGSKELSQQPIISNPPALHSRLWKKLQSAIRIGGYALQTRWLPIQHPASSTPAR